MGFPDGSVIKESGFQCRRCLVDPWVGTEDPLEKEMATHSPIFLPGESHGQRNLADYSPYGCTESDATEPLNTHRLG